ncbi:hypothetical protein CAI21_04490 [Alkalilimnicola ehrlichii]|uniref:GGDEF domain-containing protein n=1 Tax=Alkalilimnicola ehrlichii TaxID=351052 RepID=A0A3E0X1J7_9GAMM|nr:diguanylate cyclase [Alkalilimnicola ehrlichii]RFA30771.1 hypothetical protein CAI21_04490 [Alkalilimnicola ehrlichii]RFA38347.1 hypothetical protein CAL65_05855 [Alkalilimnicola ehrlichii]
MRARLKRLNPATQRIVGEAACIGNRFKLDILQLISHLQRHEMISPLSELLDEGLLSAQGDIEAWLESHDDGPVPELRFAHDRVRQTAYELVDESQQPAQHLAIGRALFAHTPPEKQEECVFDLLHQLNPGAHLIESQTERDTVARLNVIAGQRAKSASAFESALHYFNIALELLGEQAWKRHYELTLNASIQAAEAAYLCGDYERIETLTEAVLGNAHSLLEQIKIHEVRIQACMAKNELRKALNIGLEVLELLGVRFPKKPRTWHILLMLFKTQAAFAGKRYQDLLNLPLVTDPHARSVLRVLARLGSTAYIVNPNLHPLLIFKVLGYAQKYGNSAEYTFAYATYSLLLAGIIGDIDRGYSFGQLAMDLVDRTGARHLEARTVVLFNAFTTQWKRHLRTTLAPLKQAFRSGLSYGDFEYASYSITAFITHAYFAGLPLPEVEREARHYLKATESIHQGTGRNILRLSHQALANQLNKEGSDALTLIGESFDERALQSARAEDKDVTLLCYYGVHKMVMAYLLGEYRQARQHADEVRRRLSNVRAMLIVAIFRFYDSLIQLAIYPDTDFVGQRRILWRVRQNQAKLRKWSRHAPMNFRHKYLLVNAEVLRVKERTVAAMKAYEEAAELACQHEYIQEEALANELAGKFYQTLGQHRIAALHLDTATERYRRWGCHAKLINLSKQTARYRNQPSPPPQGPLSDGLAASRIDLSTLKKALKSIAAEEVHSRMIQHIVRAAVEFTGAQTGHLLLKKPDGHLYVEAEWNIDGEQPQLLQSQRPEDNQRLSLAVINYVRRTRQSIVIHDASQKQQQLPQLHHDSYIAAHSVKSILCMPILTEANDEPELTGVLYLENNRATGAFTEDGFEVLEIIGLSAAGRLELSRKAATDGLTGLYNHDHFRAILSNEFRRARRKNRPLSVIMLDVDHFKRFNDTWGHQAGDHVLREVTRTIQDCCRDSDTAARYGGEEIALILPESDTECAYGIAERIRKRVAERDIHYGGQKLRVTISAGLASLTPAITDETLLLQRADEALYAAKRGGRNRVSAHNTRLELSE